MKSRPEGAVTSILTTMHGITAPFAIAKVQAFEGKRLKGKFLYFLPLQRMKDLSEIPLPLAFVDSTLKKT